MSDPFLKRVTSPLRYSIRGQIISVLVALLFFGALILAFVFYFQARSSAVREMDRSYQVVGTMVARLSAYDFQFHRVGLKNTVDTLVKSDPNLLWAEFADAGGTVIEQAGSALQKAPFEKLDSLPSQSTSTHISTPMGPAILVRAPIVSSASSQDAAGLDEMGFAAPAQSGPAKEQTLGEIRVIVSLKTLADLRVAYFIFGSIIVLVTLIIGTAVSFLATKYLLAPIEQLSAYAQKIAEGNLTTSTEMARRKDELGRLLAGFQLMAKNLAGMIRQTRMAFQGVQGDTEAVRKVLYQNLENNREQAAFTEQVAEKMGAIQKSAETVSSLMESLSQIAEEVSSSVIEMITNIDQIAQNSEGLTEAVNTAASTLTQSVASTREIANSVDTLNRFVEDTSTSMTQMEGSIRQVEQNASETRKATELVLREAQEGTNAMDRSEHSIQQLQASFGSTVEVMRILDQRSEEVGNILSVIDEVMEQTHLLALNAAIIAAQAGEHGKSFAVVAGEIRALAEKTSLSTREIADLIGSVQKEVNRAVDSVSAQTDLVEQTVAVTRDAKSALDKIQVSVLTSLQMVQEIANATAEQSKGAAGIVRSSDQVRDLTHQLKKATQEQRAGSEQVLGAVNRIRNLSEEVKRATKEQSAGSAIIRQAMDSLTAAVGKVMGQTQTQTKASKDVERLMGASSKSSKSNLSSLQDAVEQVEALTHRAEEVGHELARFRTDIGS